MNILCRAMCLVCFSGALLGCQTVDVYDSTPNANPKGIPFYTKQPVRIQEMAYAVRATNVQIEVVVATQPPTVYSYPETPVNVIGAQKRLTEIEDDVGRKVLVKGKTLQEILSDVQLATREIVELSANSKLKDADAAAELISNTYRADSQLLAHKYFVNSKNPVIGSATADYHLNGDGTLGEASTTISDQTASTFLGLVPVSAFLSKQWNLTAPPAAQPTSSAQMTTQALARTGHFDISADQLLGIKVEPRTGAAPPAITVRFKRSQDRRVYLLRKVEALPDGRPGAIDVLTMDQAMAGVADGSIQLVRIATESQLAQQPKDSPDKKAANKAAEKPKEK